MSVQQKPMAGAVAAAVAQLGAAKAKGDAEAMRTVARRRLTVDLRIECEAADASPLAPAVAEALIEFIRDGHSSKASGVFESKIGADVKWRACNEYFDRAGFRVHVDGDRDRHPVPLGLAHVNADGSVLTVRGVSFSVAVFDTLAKPDTEKRYRFERKGDVVIVTEVP